MKIAAQTPAKRPPDKNSRSPDQETIPTPDSLSSLQAIEKTMNALSINGKKSENHLHQAEKA